METIQTIDLMDNIQPMLQPPSLILAESFLAYIDTKCLWAVVSNNIPDILSSGPLTVNQLATLTSLQPPRLRQVMRVLHNNGIFHYSSEADCYSNSPASELLKKNHWTRWHQWHQWTEMYGNEFYDMCRALPAAIKEGETRTAAQIHYKTNKSLFEFLAEIDREKKFNRTLGGGAVAQAPGMIADYDWAFLDDVTLLGIGGGGGDFIASLLRQYSKLRGGILELKCLIDLVTPFFKDREGKFFDVASRMLHFHVGNFMKEVPTYQVYTMKWTIKEGPKSRLVIIDSILSDGRSGRITRYGDITMMVAANSRERTAAEWIKLAERSGWKVDHISPLRNAWVAVIDLRPC
ncbi:hypothetical protein NHQ30_007460 [Ciborinia camelliae]|nr:hypothetical protein NHQ30_007460 [Ciborinia camelliae]